MLLDLLMRAMHILAAGILVGGSVFWAIAYYPASQQLAADDGDAFRESLRSRWARLIMMSSGMLLISGLVNIARIMMNYEIPKTTFPGTMYHMLFGVKFLLAMGVFFLSSLLAGRTSAAKRMQANAGLWFKVNLILILAVVCLGSVLKFAERTAKSAQSVRPSTPNAIFAKPIVRAAG